MMSTPAGMSCVSFLALTYRSARVSRRSRNFSASPNLSASSLTNAPSGRGVDVLGRHRLRDQAEDERHRRLAGLGLLLARPHLVVGIAFVRQPLHPDELELRHSQPLVPPADAVVIVAPRLLELQVQEPDARLVAVLELLG